MACSIYKFDLSIGRKYLITYLPHHTKMGPWLKINGDPNFIYEIWKIRGIHSRWKWKIKKGKWGRTATPSKNKQII
jgi:hypothetical protein